MKNLLNVEEINKNELMIINGGTLPRLDGYIATVSRAGLEIAEGVLTYSAGFLTGFVNGWIN
ncbi:MAG: hypothetical protein COZ17_11500 [Flavobacteriaceae bacterium CG_4_10_14_3_um_filter_33_47]|nr:MAG: hypothetical protein COZ17_11500 [Flavobacteriaceae bacterium CG_4_10_14_3_um_filter_33_47]PJB18189.1 MAG: hypothetical protein CO117_08890 [Flavobacteriaceae bacterium CG_4_9_14_3_um_filter_33_16]